MPLPAAVAFGKHGSLMKEHWVLYLLLTLCFLIASTAYLRAAPAAEKPLLLPRSGALEEDGNVRNFGAVGDGKTDDTTAIQHAVDDSRAGRVIFPRGDFRITKTIEIKLGARADGLERTRWRGARDDGGRGTGVSFCRHAHGQR